MQSPTDNQVGSYFRDLLSKHPQAQKITQSLQEPIAKYEEEISNGRYNIQQQNQANPEKSDHKGDKPEQMTPEEHELFMKKLREEKERVRAMKKQRINQEREKEKQEKQELSKKEEQEKKEKELHKKKEIEERILAMNVSRQRRNSQTQASNKALVSIKKSETLHQKLLANYLHSEASSLEDKKKKLAEIRALHKPLSKDEFEQHNQKILKLKLKVNEQRSHLKDKRSASVTDIYKSMWYQKAKEHDPAQQLTEAEQLEAKRAKQMRDKLKKYGDYVKSNFKPEVDSRKADQLKELMANNTHHAIDTKGDESRAIGLQYLKYSKEHIASARSVNENKTNTNITTSSKGQKPVNYLEELKKNRKAAAEEKITSVQNILKQPLEEKQKVELVMGQVEKMEEQAKRKEKLSKVNHKVVDEELDQLYVDTIKAKLALLK